MKKGRQKFYETILKDFGEPLKKVVRNFARRVENIFEGIQEPRWPRASNSLCTPLTAAFTVPNCST